MFTIHDHFLSTYRGSDPREVSRLFAWVLRGGHYLNETLETVRYRSFDRRQWACYRKRPTEGTLQSHPAQHYASRNFVP